MIPSHLSHQRRGTSPYGPGRDSKGITVRGVVIRTILPGSSEASARADTRGYSRDVGVKCDVYIIEPGFRTILRDVPVARQSAGLNDHEVWVPRETTVNVETGEALTVASAGVPPTPAHNMDGDHVLVTFAGNDNAKPMIVGAIDHPRTNYAPDASYAYKYFRRIRGCELGVTNDGNVEISLEGGNNGSITVPGGAEIPTPGAGLSGNMTIELGTGTLPTAAKVSIVDSGVSAPEPVILGDSWLGREDSHLGSLVTLLTALTTATAETQAAWQTLGLPTAGAAALQTAIGVMQATIAADRAQIAAARSVGLPYLSSHLEVD